MTVKPKTKRRERILATSLQMFNEQGSHKVSTNHIAKAMGISPGNLYYHFKNKEHIIRELLACLIEGFDSLVQVRGELKSGIDLIAETIEATAQLIYAYRFIYIELAALLTRDEMFKAMYYDIKTRRAQEFATLFDFVSQMGGFQQSIATEEQDAIVFIVWTYAEAIITALHTSNIPVTPATIQDHFKKIVYILKAHLTPVLWSELTRKLDLTEKS
jgi:AcrR family transcriptional regulator